MPRRKPEPEPELEITERDYVMARLAAGRAALQAATNAIDDALNLFINPDQDKSGKQRKEALDEALESAGAACRALEAAEEEIGEVTWSECEPWEDEEEDEAEDDEDDDVED